ncbi:hypothetical protein [Allomuricauda sp. d1]|uniref:hypothetical protein n=1 Tax=Allomuricauda sp. d1 TaxID=3136725 RepID=UPI0031E2D3AD
MKPALRTHYIKIILLSWAFLTSTLLLSQNNLTYEGELKVGNYVGNANYHYKIVDGDTLLHGPFEMQRSNLGALLEEEDVTFLFSGGFQDNYPEGRWRFEFGEFRSDRQTEVVGYQYKVNISGSQELAQGNIEKGKPDGEWIYTINQIEDSEVAETQFQSTIEFDNGVPQKSFRIEKGDSTLVGRFLRNGLAHDEWTLFSDTAIEALERWHFENGRLQRIEVQRDGQKELIDVYVGAIQNGQTINLDEHYIQILKIHAEKGAAFDVFAGGMNQLLAENAKYYQKIDDILSELGESEFLPKFKVKVPYFPLDSLEIAQLDSIKVQTEKSSAISSALLEDTQLNILKLSDEQASFLYNAVEEISRRFLKPLNSLVRYQENDIVAYVSRNALITHLWPKGVPLTEMAIMGNDSTAGAKTFAGPNASGYDFSKENIETLYKISTYASASLDSIQLVLNTKLAKQKRQLELIALEEQLIAKTDALTQMVDSVDGKLPKNENQALHNIKKMLDTELATYSKMEETQGKLDKARQLAGCFEAMEKLAIAVAKQSSRWEEIQQKYTDAIWNPFMANIMDEEVKKRLTNAYRKVLIPHIMNIIANDLSCENAEDLATLLDDAYTRMLQLRDEDTSKLERKLKREEDPNVVMQLLNLQAVDEN